MGRRIYREVTEKQIRKGRRSGIISEGDNRSYRVVSRRKDKRYKKVIEGDRTFIDELTETQLKQKLKYIRLRWGVDEGFLREFVSSPEYESSLKEVSRSERIKFKLRLEALTRCFNALSGTFPKIVDRLRTSDPYDSRLMDILGTHKYLEHVVDGLEDVEIAKAHDRITEELYLKSS